MNAAKVSDFDAVSGFSTSPTTIKWKQGVSHVSAKGNICCNEQMYRVQILRNCLRGGTFRKQKSIWCDFGKTGAQKPRLCGMGNPRRESAYCMSSL
jgi:hypothetical protein